MHTIVRWLSAIVEMGGRGGALSQCTLPCVALDRRELGGRRGTQGERASHREGWAGGEELLSMRTTVWLSAFEEPAMVDLLPGLSTEGLLVVWASAEQGRRSCSRCTGRARFL